MNSVQKQAQENLKALSENPYPGRGIVMGRSAVGDLMQIYWVMGRSEKSRNRVLLLDRADGEEVVRTAAFDPLKVEDPSLIIYNAMRQHGDFHIVSNGDQTDTVVQFLKEGNTVDEALASRSYEPDDPNFTPRITGIINDAAKTYLMWITRKHEATGLPEHSHGLWSKFAVDALGECIHTYRGDGSPLPPFEGRPYAVPLGEGVVSTAETYWDTLNPDNRVALVAKSIDSETGTVDYHIINALNR